MAYGLGIDVGTTYTAAALFRDNNVEVFSLGTYQVAVPSVIFAAGEEFLFGAPAERRGTVDADGLAREFKRRMGDSVPMMLSGSPYHADRLTALMAKWVIDAVAEQTGEGPSQVVITHPANWTDYQLSTFRNALDEVNHERVELISEPAAAALDYAAATNVSPGALVLVYDLGGGTFDVALLRRHENSFEHAIEPSGIERLGGIDFDEAVFQYVLSSIPSDALRAAHQQPEGLAALAQVRRACVDAKESLSSNPAADIPVVLPSYTATVRITRLEFEDMIRPMVRQTIELVQHVVHRADIEPSTLSAVLLVGGSSRIPLVPQMVSEELGLPVRIDAHPKLVVAKGAARRAGQIDATTRPTGRGTQVGRARRDVRRPRGRALLIPVALLLAVVAAGAVWLGTRSGSDASDASTATTDTGLPSASTIAAATTVPAATTVAAAAGTYAEQAQLATRTQPVDLELIGTDLWVMSYSDGILQRFDTQTADSPALDELDLQYHEGPSGNDIIRHDDLLYVTQYDGNSVALVDSTNRQLVQRIAVEGRPLNGALLDDTVWVAAHPNEGTFDAGHLVPINGTTVGPAWEMEYDPWYVLAVDDELWVTFDEADRVGRVDPETGATDFVEVVGGPVDLLAVGDDIWVTLSRRNRIAVIDRDTVTVRTELEVNGPRPFKLVSAMGSVWVTNHGDGGTPSTVTRLDPATGSPLQADIAVGAGPLELAAGEDRIFVTNFGGRTVSVLALDE